MPRPLCLNERPVILYQDVAVLPPPHNGSQGLALRAGVDVAAVHDLGALQGLGDACQVDQGGEQIHELSCYVTVRAWKVY